MINKTNELQTFAIDSDLICVTETWLKPKILSVNDFAIYRQDRLGIESLGVFYVQCETPYRVVEEKISKLELKFLLVNLNLRTGRKF